MNHFLKYKFVLAVFIVFILLVPAVSPILASPLPSSKSCAGDYCISGIFGNTPCLTDLDCSNKSRCAGERCIIGGSGSVCSNDDDCTFGCYEGTNESLKYKCVPRSWGGDIWGCLGDSDCAPRSCTSDGRCIVGGTGGSCKNSSECSISPVIDVTLPTPLDYLGICDKALFKCVFSSLDLKGGECNADKDCTEIFSKIPGCDSIGPLGKCVVGGDPDRIRPSCLADANCRGALSDIVPPPVINTVVPLSIVVQQPNMATPTTMTIVGKGFTPETRVVANGLVLTPDFVQSTENVLSVQVPRSVVSVEGILNVKAVNPGKDNQGVSNAKPIIISENKKIKKVEPISNGLKIGDEGVAQKVLNVRSAPSLTATILTKLNLGAMAIITGGPKIADGYVWWQINKGWIAQSISVVSGQTDNQVFFISNKPFTQPSPIAYTGYCSKDGKKCLQSSTGLSGPLNSCYQLKNGNHTCPMLQKFLKFGSCNRQGSCVPNGGGISCVHTLVGNPKFNSCKQPPKIEPALIWWEGICKNKKCVEMWDGNGDGFDDNSGEEMINYNCLQLDSDTNNCSPTFQEIKKEGFCKDNKCFKKGETGYDPNGIRCYTTDKGDSCYQAYKK